ncbi:MAG: HU family DNA-binding protein [Bacteroidota bacterium]
MSVPYNVIAKANPAKRNAPAKYYAVANSNGEVNFRQLAKEIAEITTVSLPDAVAALESLVMIIPRHIEKGEIVRLGELGSLRVTINSEGSDTEEEVNASKIKKANYRFAAGSELKQTLKLLKYQRVKKAESAPAPETT